MPQDLFYGSGEKPGAEDATGMRRQLKGKSVFPLQFMRIGYKVGVKSHTDVVVHIGFMHDFHPFGLGRLVDIKGMCPCIAVYGDVAAISEHGADAGKWCVPFY